VKVIRVLGILAAVGGVEARISKGAVAAVAAARWRTQHSYVSARWGFSPESKVNLQLFNPSHQLLQLLPQQWLTSTCSFNISSILLPALLDGSAKADGIPDDLLQQGLAMFTSGNEVDPVCFCTTQPSNSKEVVVVSTLRVWWSGHHWDSSMIVMEDCLSSIQFSCAPL
jgi:hypothetical protein